jgi:hypothetical protein
MKCHLFEAKTQRETNCTDKIMSGRKEIYGKQRQTWEMYGLAPSW